MDSAFVKALYPNGQENPGVQFKEFKATGLNGKGYSRDSLKNKIGFISFWFASCMPCIAEFDALNGLYKKYRNNNNFLFLSFTYEEPAVAKDIAAKYHLE